MSNTLAGSRAESQFGPYYLMRLLGRGSTGEVYEAQDTVNQRAVALKLVSPTLSHDAECRRRLQVEAQAAQHFQHPHVVPITDFGEIDGQLFLEMRLVEGTSLSERLKEHGPFDPAPAVAIVGQVATALDAAHAAGLLHRDVKPENILVTDENFVYLMDFGIADVAARDGTTPVEDVSGTFRYSAPERFIDAPMDHRVDVYSLACVLYECLTGWSPYRGDNAGTLITAHLMRPTPRPSQLRIGTVPEDFDDVIARGMAKDPRQRYGSTGELALAAYRALRELDQREVDSIVENTEVAVSSAAPSPPFPSSPAIYPGPAGDDTVQAAPRTTATSSSPLSPDPNRPGNFVFPRPHPVRRKATTSLPIAAVVLAVVVIGGTVAWLARSSSPPNESSPTSTTTTATASRPPDTAAQARLMKLIPPGYPPGSCTPTDPPGDALAKVSCSRNIDPGGPLSASYRLFGDAATLRAAFDHIAQTSTVHDCPGRIQSPGPWRRSATPEQPSGMLLCASRKATPIVAWTTDADGLISVVDAGGQETTMDQLYAWWSLHS